jgi:hypothetical protein
VERQGNCIKRSLITHTGHSVTFRIVISTMAGYVDLSEHRNVCSTLMRKRLGKRKLGKLREIILSMIIDNILRTLDANGNRLLFSEAGFDISLENMSHQC